MEQDWKCIFELEWATVRINEIKFRKPLCEDGIGSATYLVSVQKKKKKRKEYALRLVSIRQIFLRCYWLLP